MKKVKILFHCFIALLFICRSVFAQSKALINEFAIEPSQSIELINNSADPVDISGWYIDDSGGTTFFTIPANSILFPNSCLVFSADFNLNKSSADTIRLFDNTAQPSTSSANLIDSFSYSSSAGSGISYLRLPDKSANWTTGASSFGKLNESGENCLFTLTATPTSTPSPTPTVSEEPTTTPSVSYENIFISEVMVAPETGGREWVEIYNANDFTTTLTNWYIDDGENAGASPKAFSLTISPKGFATFDLATSVFNNDGDSVRLLDNQKSPKDSFEYASSIKGKTLGRISFEDDIFCVQEPTKGKENGNCIDSPTPTEAAQSAETPTLTTILAKQSPTSRPLAQQAPTGNSLNTTVTSLDTIGSVLGESNDKAPPPQLNNLGKTFSFLSFSYSILTICSVLLRMKLNA